MVRESVVLTDTEIGVSARLSRAILDKRIKVGQEARIGTPAGARRLTMVGKGSEIPAGAVLEAGARVGTDVIASDFPADLRVSADAPLETQRRAHQV